MACIKLKVFRWVLKAISTYIFHKDRIDTLFIFFPLRRANNSGNYIPTQVK
jgi:hypothetical protein